MSKNALHQQRTIATLGIEAARCCLGEELLRPYWPDYRRRLADYTQMQAHIDARLQPPAYNGWMAAIGRQMGWI